MGRLLESQLTPQGTYKCDAYPLLRLRAKQIQPGRSWSAFTLKQELAWDWGARQLHRTARQEARRAVRLQLAPTEVPMRLAA
jgi:hypothetical protein